MSKGANSPLGNTSTEPSNPGTAQELKLSDNLTAFRENRLEVLLLNLMKIT